MLPSLGNEEDCVALDKSFTYVWSTDSPDRKLVTPEIRIAAIPLVAKKFVFEIGDVFPGDPFQ